MVPKILSDRPRERLMAHGPSVLTDAEVLAILLSPGNGKTSGGELAERLVKRFGSIKGLCGRRVGELAQVDGLGFAKACRILAAVELGRRSILQWDDAPTLSSPPQVANHCAYLATERDELFLALAVNVRNRLAGEWIVARGWESGVNITVRQVYTLLLKENASRVIFVHNHPSGDPSPSEQDVAFTQKLIAGGRCLNVKVLDHVVVARTGHASLRELYPGRLDFW